MGEGLPDLLGSDIAFWQLLLGAEMPAEKAHLFLSSLAPADNPAQRLKAWPHLTAVEARNMARAEAFSMDGPIENGVACRPLQGLVRAAEDLEKLPPAAFCWGDPSVLDRPLLGIVGTRSATTYGRAVARKFAQHLAERGACIISGGALGIDAAAHEGALDSTGATVAVLGTGVEGVYPPQHRGLFERIRLRGCLLSPFALGAKPHRYHFLTRNELIAALCDGLLVVEAPIRSGAMHSAARAAERGRPVFVVPGGIELESFRGSHHLIREGAALVDHPDQIAAELKLSGPAPTTKRDEFSELQSRILGALTTSPQAPEVLAERIGIDPSELLSELTMLELDGLVIRDQGSFAACP